MFIVSRLDGKILKTRLELRRPANGRAHFVLSARDSAGHRMTIGPMAAAIGYRLIKCTAEERLSMLLAGIHLAGTGNRAALLQLHTVLSTAKKPNKSTRRHKKPKDPVPSKHASTARAGATASAAPERFDAATPPRHKDCSDGLISNGRHSRYKRPSSPPGKATSG